LVRQAHGFGRLATAVALAYWFVCLIGLHALPRGYQRQVTSWGRASIFCLALARLAERKVHGVVKFRRRGVEHRRSR
jgi:hypothetical protein